MAPELELYRCAAYGWIDGVVSPGPVDSEGYHPLLLEESLHTDEGLPLLLPSRRGDTLARKLAGPEQ